MNYCRSGDFRVFRFSRICDFGTVGYTMSKIRELSISMIGGAIIIIFRVFLKFAAIFEKSPSCTYFINISDKFVK